VSPVVNRSFRRLVVLRSAIITPLSLLREPARPLWFPKIRSGRFGAVSPNQGIIHSMLALVQAAPARPGAGIDPTQRARKVRRHADDRRARADNRWTRAAAHTLHPTRARAGLSAQQAQARAASSSVSTQKLASIVIDSGRPVFARVLMVVATWICSLDGKRGTETAGNITRGNEVGDVILRTRLAVPG
jgi:hypothetical protein